MHSPRLLNTLVVALSLMSTAQASFFDSQFLARSGFEIAKRQDDSAAATPTESSGPSDTTSSSPPDDTTSSSGPTQSDPITTTSNKPTTTSNPPPGTTTNNQPTQTTSNPPDATTSEPGSTSKPPVSTITHIVTQTNDQGQPTTFTSKSTSSPTPGLQEGGSSGNNNSGMDPQTKKIVIGVVVGVGGAIILAGIAYAIWRVWGRKKNQNDPDALIDYGAGYHPVEKNDVGGTPSGPARSPFQSTLESYHAPTHVNQASNF